MNVVEKDVNLQASQLPTQPTEQLQNLELSPRGAILMTV